MLLSLQKIRFLIKATNTKYIVFLFIFTVHKWKYEQQQLDADAGKEDLLLVHLLCREYLTRYERNTLFVCRPSSMIRHSNRFCVLRQMFQPFEMISYRVLNSYILRTHLMLCPNIWTVKHTDHDNVSDTLFYRSIRNICPCCVNMFCLLPFFSLVCYKCMIVL